VTFIQALFSSIQPTPLFVNCAPPSPALTVVLPDRYAVKKKPGAGQAPG